MLPTSKGLPVAGELGYKNLNRSTEVPMFTSRRKLLIATLVALGVLCVWQKSLTAQEGGSPPPMSPPRVVQPKNPPEPDAATKTILAEENRKALKKDVERLCDLATQLKTYVEKTDSTTVLSLALVKKAEEIEKLAKHIKGRVKL